MGRSERAKSVVKKTFDEELREILWDTYGSVGDVSQGKNALEAIKALMKKHQPEPRKIYGNVTHWRDNGYNQALADSDKAYGLEKDYSCEICGADPMTPNCNNANCDR